MSTDYYNHNAQIFFDNTIDVDMTPLYQHFVSRLPAYAKVVDAGCGSGRDSKYFLSLGYEVTAFDASKELVILASQNTIHPIIHSTFLNCRLDDNSQDGIWACASLLHVPYQELRETFSHLSKALKPHGIFYCSFKYGADEIERDGRRFTNLNENEIKKLLMPVDLHIDTLWITEDRRPGRENEQWLNAILIKR